MLRLARNPQKRMRNTPGEARKTAEYNVGTTGSARKYKGSRPTESGAETASVRFRYPIPSDRPPIRQAAGRKSVLSDTMKMSRPVSSVWAAAYSPTTCAVMKYPTVKTPSHALTMDKKDEATIHFPNRSTASRVA